MTCKLCLEEKPLCKKSHIFSNFLYKNLLTDMVRVELKDDHVENVYTGEFEANILCYDCEVRISAWESYAKTMLYGGRLPSGSQVQMRNEINQHGVRFTYVSGLDYKRFKLFLLSLLWRASISSRRFFKKTLLGEHQEQLRQMLNDEDPGPAESYPCFMSSYRTTDLPTQIVGEPRIIQTENGGACTFLIDGVMYVYYLSKEISADWILEGAANSSGEMRVVHMPEENARKLLLSFFGKRDSDP